MFDLKAAVEHLPNKGRVKSQLKYFHALNVYSDRSHTLEMAFTDFYNRLYNVSLVIVRAKLIYLCFMHDISNETNV